MLSVNYIQLFIYKIRINGDEDGMRTHVGKAQWISTLDLDSMTSQNFPRTFSGTVELYPRKLILVFFNITESLRFSLAVRQ